MGIVLRVILIASAILLFMYMVKKIRQSKMKIEHTIFWILFDVILIIVGVFPQIIYLVSGWIGFQSPVNMVFLMIIFVLIVKNFLTTLEISHLENKVDSLIQQIAIRNLKEGEKEVQDETFKSN